MLFKKCNVFFVSVVYDVSNLYGRSYGGCAIINFKKLYDVNLLLCKYNIKTNCIYIIDNS